MHQLIQQNYSNERHFLKCYFLWLAMLFTLAVSARLCIDPVPKTMESIFFLFVVNLLIAYILGFLAGFTAAKHTDTTNSSEQANGDLEQAAKN